MKKFLSVQKFKELRVLFFLELMMALLLATLVSTNDFGEINYWDWRAFLISMITWSVSSIIDKETYWDLATLLGTGSFMYLLWWFVFNVFLFR
jgi:hypothetical protein